MTNTKTTQDKALLRIMCEECGKEYANSNTLKNHKEKSHKDISRDEIIEITRVLENDGDTFEEEIKAESNLLEEIEKMTQNINLEDKQDNELVEKLKRFKNICEMNTKLIKHLQTRIKNFVREGGLSKEVENIITKELKEKDARVEELERKVKEVQEMF